MRKILSCLLIIFCFSGNASALPEYSSSKRPILIQGAMYVETDYLMSVLEEPEDYRIGSWKFKTGKIDGYPVVVSITRCGSMHISAATVLALETFNPCAVINQGTAGAHDPELSRGDIVVCADTFNGSARHSWPSAKGEGADYTLLSTKFYDEVRIPEEVISYDAVFISSDRKLLDSARSVYGTYKAGKVKEGRIVTYDSWESRIDRILFLHETYGTSCEEMETFHAANLCRLYGVPFLGVRIMSNSALKNQDFLPETGTECQKFVLEIAKKYIEELN